MVARKDVLVRERNKQECAERRKASLLLPPENAALGLAWLDQWMKVLPSAFSPAGWRHHPGSGPVAPA